MEKQVAKVAERPTMKFETIAYKLLSQGAEGVEVALKCRGCM